MLAQFLTSWLVDKATKEYVAYKEQQRQIEHFDSIRQLDQDLKRIAPRKSNKTKKDNGENNQ